MSRIFIGHGLRALAWALVLLVAAAGAARAEGVTPTKVIVMQPGETREF